MTTLRHYDFKNGYEAYMENGQITVSKLRTVGPQTLIEKIRCKLNPNLSFSSTGSFDHSELPENLMMSKYASTRWAKFDDIPMNILNYLFTYLTSLPPTNMYERWKLHRSLSKEIEQ